MPDHVHLLITVEACHNDRESVSQLIPGRFSYRLKKEHDFSGEIWQRGFSELRADDAKRLQAYRQYIAQNPVKAGLANSPDEYPYCFRYLARMKKSGA